jgi:hypothetical protein
MTEALGPEFDSRQVHAREAQQVVRRPCKTEVTRSSRVMGSTCSGIPTEEKVALKAAQCGFESHPEHVSNAVVTQWLEYRPVKPGAVGSNPIVGA